jgi:putative acetyltransferase
MTQKLLGIRKARPADAQQIRDVHVLAGKGPDSLERNNKSVLRWMEKRVAADYLQAMQTEVFVVAELNNRLCGFGAVNLLKAEITSVYVDPDFTRQGIASSLVSLMELAATDAGLPALELQAAGGALTFYEKQGYVYVTSPATTGPLWAQMRKDLKA